MSPGYNVSRTTSQPSSSECYQSNLPFVPAKSGKEYKDDVMLNNNRLKLYRVVCMLIMLCSTDDLENSEGYCVVNFQNLCACDKFDLAMHRIYSISLNLRHTLTLGYVSV